MDTRQLTVTENPRIYAGFWLRVLAALIDAFVMFIPFCWITLFTILFIRFVIAPKRDDYDTLLMIIGIPLVTLIATRIYFALLESSPLQASIGKLVVGVYVTDTEGRRITLGRATGRTFAKLLSSMTLGIGYILSGFTKKKQALHDLFAKCLVLRGRRPV
jgi:uncharacterized RDD family membrane protein YckC